MAGEPRVLPACQRCKIRKVGCDRKAPKCSNCTKGTTACIIIDPTTGEQYARHYIQQLEQQESRLQKQLGIRSIISGEEQAVTSTTDGSGTPQDTLVGRDVDSHGYVGEGSGLSFLHSILSEDKWVQHRPRILSQLAARPQIQTHHVELCSLPPLQEAEQLLENYFARFHIHHTFLLRQDVLNLFSELYGPPPSTSDPSFASITSRGPPSAQSHFRLFMIFAISAITRYRAGLCFEHPYGYFKAAEVYLGSIPLFKDPDAIQNLLLIARFGMYHHIGTSLWEISQLCMRQCIEHRLHMRPSQSVEPMTEQHQRRIFWECYVLDRYSSGILGRPFAIAEADIHVPLPVDMDDNQIFGSGAICLDTIPRAQTTTITELSIFIVFIKLRIISSRIHTTFYTGPAQSSEKTESSVQAHSVGHAYSAYSRFRRELDAWRIIVPTFSDPRSLYERSDWHDFMYHKDMLLLTRGVMHKLHPILSPASSVIKEILAACYSSASHVIRLYAGLMDERMITWTRSYFQVIFTAGLTVTYSISLGALKDEPQQSALHDQTFETLAKCSRILAQFKEHMPDVASFAVLFDLLREEYVREKDVNMSANSTLDFGRNYPTATADTMQPNFPIGVMDQHQTIDESNYHEAGANDTDAELSSSDFGLALKDGFTTQLDLGSGEYAWASLLGDGNFWDQFSFA